MQLYNQFIEFCNSLLQYVTTQRLVYGALLALSFFLFWTVVATLSSSIKKFNRRCEKLRKYLRKNKVGYENIDSVDRYARKISRGFFYGWNKFKKSLDKKPSDYLTKRDVLDAEVSDGVLNHGKTLMKSFVGITTVLLFILNLAFLGKDAPVTFNILVESMFLPFVYYVVMMLFYFVSSLIKQQTYIIATAHFYALVDLLDKCFEKPSFHAENFYEKKVETIDELKEENDVLSASEPQKEKDEQIESDVVENPQEEPVVEDVQEEPVAENIQVESDAEEEQHEDIEENADEAIEDRVQENQEVGFDLSQFEVNDETIQEPIEQQTEETENLEESQTEEVVEKIEEQPQSIDVPISFKRDWENEENLDYYDVFKKKNINVDKYLNEIPNDSEGDESPINIDQEVMPIGDEEIDEKKNDSLNEFSLDDFDLEKESLSEDNIDVNNYYEVNDLSQNLSENENDDIVSKNNDEELSNELTNEEKLEENEVDEVQEIENNEENVDDEESIEEDIDDEDIDIFIEEDTDLEDTEVLDEENVKSENPEEVDFYNESEKSNIDIFSESTDFEDNQNLPDNELKTQIEQNLSESLREIDSKLEDNIQENIDLSALVSEFKHNYNEEAKQSVEEIEQPVEEIKENISEKVEKEIKSDFNTKEIFDKINDLENLIHSAIGNNVGSKSEEKLKNSKKGKKKMTTENENVKKSRGRPKMQTIDENLVINSEEEFEDILSRAEKLMRKSETGLSASQSKRIEKELKIMMDAMNKFKEGQR